MRFTLLTLAGAALIACGPPSPSAGRGGGGGGGGNANDAGGGNTLDAALPGSDASTPTPSDAGAQPVDPTIEQACNQVAATVARQCPDQIQALVAWCRAEYATISQTDSPIATCLQSFAATCDLDALHACATTGQGASGFEDLGNGVVVHTATGRHWQQRASNSKRNQDDSRSYCSRLTLGGHSDWQMPTWQQYRSICRPNNEPCAWPEDMSGPCGGGTTNAYWAQTHTDNRGQRTDLSVGFGGGDWFNCQNHNNQGIGRGAINTNDSDRLYVRCVRTP